MASNFKVDTLIKTFKDLQEEKSCLEQKLRELREKRRRVETEDETASVKLMQVKEVHAKMAEVQRVSQHKVMQTQSQLNQLEEINAKKRKIVKDWKNRISEEKARRVEERVLFEKELNQMSVVFLEAKDYYTPRNLQEQISKQQHTQRLFDLEMTNEQRQIHQMTNRLQDMLLQNAKDDMEITKQEQRVVMEALVKERNLLEERFNHQQAQIGDMKNHHQRLQREAQGI